MITPIKNGKTVSKYIEIIIVGIPIIFISALEFWDIKDISFWDKNPYYYYIE